MKINKLIKEIENCDDVISVMKREREELVEKLKDKLARAGLGIVELDFNKKGDDSEWIDWRELREGDIVVFERSVVAGGYADVTKGNEYTVKEIEVNKYTGNMPIRITMDDNGGMGWVNIEQAGRVKLIHRPK